MVRTPQDVLVSATIIEFHLPFVYFLIEKNDTMLIAWKHMKNFDDPLKIATMATRSTTELKPRIQEGDIIRVPWGKGGNELYTAVALRERVIKNNRYVFLYYYEDRHVSSTPFLVSRKFEMVRPRSVLPIDSLHDPSAEFYFNLQFEEPFLTPSSARQGVSLLAIQFTSNSSEHTDEFRSRPLQVEVEILPSSSSERVNGTSNDVVIEELNESSVSPQSPPSLDVSTATNSRNKRRSPGALLSQTRARNKRRREKKRQKAMGMLMVQH